MRDAIKATEKKSIHQHIIGQPLTYDSCLRYTSKCASNAWNKANTFEVPKEWLSNV